MPQIVFEVPEGFDLEGEKPGTPFDVLAQVQFSEDGKMSLLSVQGYEVGKAYDENEEKESVEQEPSENTEELDQRSLVEVLQSRVNENTAT